MYFLYPCLNQFMDLYLWKRGIECSRLTTLDFCWAVVKMNWAKWKYNFPKRYLGFRHIDLFFKKLFILQIDIEYPLCTR